MMPVLLLLAVAFPQIDSTQSSDITFHERIIHVGEQIQQRDFETAYEIAKDAYEQGVDEYGEGRPSDWAAFVLFGNR